MRILICLLVTLVVIQPIKAAAQPVDALTDDQRTAIKLAQAQAAEKAAPLALRLAGVVKQIYTNNLSEAPDTALTSALDAEMKELVWQLLLVKGESMWAAVRVLTPAQRATIREQVANITPGSDLPDLGDLIARTFKLNDKK